MNQVKINDNWKGGIAKSITFIVTKDCQLACKYCYLVGKNTKERMPWEIAKQAIDYIFDNEREFPEESVVWDFIGGEPFLEIGLIDRICDYIKIEMFGLIPTVLVFLPMASTIAKRKYSSLLRRISAI